MEQVNKGLLLTIINQRLQDKYQQYMQSLWLVLTTNNNRWIEQLEQDEKAYNDELTSPELMSLIGRLETEYAMDAQEKRQVQSLYNESLELSFNPMLQHSYTKLWNEMHYLIATNKTEYNGKKLTEQQVLRIFENEKDNNKRKELWYQYMKVGIKLEHGLLELVNMRNKIAKEKGFNSFFDLKLHSQGVAKKELNLIIGQLRNNLDSAYSYVKNIIDKQIQKELNLNKKDIYPWHYHHPFFQEYKFSYLEGSSLHIALVKDRLTKWFHDASFDITSILKNSDVTSNKRKSGANFCLNIDRDGDVRISSHYNKSQKSLSLLMHELGHGIYEYYIKSDLPFLLKKSSEIFMSEAIAIFFERLSSTKGWYSKVISNEEKDSNNLINEQNLVMNQLVKLYWTITLITFEQELYNNPNQDLNCLWWDIVEEVQQIKRPTNCDLPVWAVKPHLTTLPAYYHNYLLGDIIASQLSNFVEKKYRSSHSPEGLQYLKEKIFSHGHSKNWKSILRMAIHDDLNPGYLIYDIKQNLEKNII